MDRNRSGAAAFLTGLQTPSQATESVASASERAQSELNADFGDLELESNISLRPESAQIEPPKDSPLVTGEETIEQFEDRLEEGFWQNKKALREGRSDMQRLSSEMQCL